VSESKPPKVQSTVDPEGKLVKEKTRPVKNKDGQKMNESSPESAETKPIKSPSNVNDLIQIALSMPKSIIEIQVNLESLPLEQKVTGEEILQLLSKPDFDITEKFKSHLISIENLDQLLIQTQNLSLALTSFSNHQNQKALRIIKSKSLATIIEFERFTKLSMKSYLVPRHMFKYIADEIVVSSVYRKSQVRIQLEVISFFANQSIDPTKLISGLGDITSEFNKEDEFFQNRFIESLRRFNICSVFQFLSHMDSERIRVALCNKINQDLTVKEIAEFFTWTNPEVNLSKIGLYKRIIVPSVENFIKWNNNLEDLLYLWPYLTNPEYGFNLSEIKVKFKQLIAKSGYLAESLRDGAVPVLQNEIQVLKESLQVAEKRAEDLSQKLNVLIKVNEEIKADLDEVRVTRLENSREARAAQEAIERQIRIDTLRELIPTMERALASDAQNEILHILEEHGIEMVGRVGQKIRWNSQICESLTGGEISEGLVVKTGFTWFDGKEIVPLRRMLLKSE
jgi:hypothetical protein